VCGVVASTQTFNLLTFITRCCKAWPDYSTVGVVSLEISGNLPRKISGKFPEIYTENIPPVKTFQITVYLLTSSLFIAVYIQLWSLVVN